MIKASSLPADALKEMGKKSQSIISEWSLDRFVEEVLQAIKISLRPHAGVISSMITRFWKGQIKIN